MIRRMCGGRETNGMDDRRPTRGRCPSSFSGDVELQAGERRREEKGTRKGVRLVPRWNSKPDVAKSGRSRRSESLEINRIGFFDGKHKIVNRILRPIYHDVSTDRYCLCWMYAKVARRNQVRLGKEIRGLRGQCMFVINKARRWKEGMGAGLIGSL